MTVSSQTSNETFHGNGVTTVWDLPFRFFSNSDIFVYRVDPITQVTTLLVLGTDYTLTGAGLPEQFGVAPGKITTTVPMPTGKDLYVERVMDIEQLTDIVNQGKFFPEVHEDVFDRLTMLIQQDAAQLSRALLRPVGKDYYDAQNRIISNVKDPVALQDAVTIAFMQQYVGGLIGAGTGPMNLASNVLYIDPYGVTKVVQNMSGDAGAGLIGIKQPGVNTVRRDLYKVHQKEVRLANYVAGGLDDQIQFNNMLADIPNKTTSRLITIGGLQSSYSGTTPRCIVESADLRLSDSLALPAYVKLFGEEVLVTQTGGVTKDIFTGVAYLWDIEGFNLAGGRHGFSFHNDNINSAMVEIRNCDIQLMDGAAFNTFATGTDGLGNPWSHLSCEFNVHKVRILACKQAIINACDNMTVSNSWIGADKGNINPSTAQIINKGISATDPNCLTRIHLKDCMLIPNVGQLGVDRVAGVRWADNYGSFVATRTRFGGENGGMRIVDQLGAPNTQFPWNSQEVAFYECFLFAGPDGAADSCVMGIQNQIPNRFVMRDCTGPLSSPVIANLSSLNIPAYMAAFEAASGKKAYEYFKVLIDDVNHDLNAYTPLRPIIPASLQPYTLRGRSTKVRKQNQSITNALQVNLVSFTTVVSDNVGAFAIANPTRFVMPNGCAKMTITVSVIMAVDGAAKTIIVDLVDSGGTYVDGEGELKGINPDADRIKTVFKVEGAPGTYWQLRIRHNAASGPLNMIDCQVDVTPNDYLG
jgi:hypothetical protein